MFKCRTCSEKDLRILDLKEQLQYLKDQLHPKPQTKTYELVQDIEADMTLSGGGGDEIDLTAEMKENEKIQRESDFIFSGNSEIEH